MKKIIGVLLLMLFFKISFAMQINENTAKMVALNFLKTKTNSEKLKNTKSIELIYKSSEKGTVYFYVFNVNPIGFIVISGDDRVMPVLSYSYESSYDTSKINKSAAQWFDGYKLQIKNVIENNLKPTEDIQKMWNELNTTTILHKKRKKNKHRKISTQKS